jgi:hypothetical protein
MSCDQTHDVLDHFLKGFEKYWPDCPFDVYIGSNTIIDSPNYKYINVQKNNWRTETINQITEIKKIDNKVTHLIVFLDDFILNNTVSNKLIEKKVNYAIEKDIKYLRLKKIEEPLFILLFYKIINLFNPSQIFKIRKSHPYYSSLQVTLWNIDYLDFLVKKCTNIWNFEEINMNKYDHYTINNTIISYKHIVEKGKWEYYAKDYCIRNISYFKFGDRISQSTNFNRKLYFTLKRIKFIFFGYIKFTK